jgi:hypothetical protein
LMHYQSTNPAQAFGEGNESLMYSLHQQYGVSYRIKKLYLFF